MNHCLFLTRPLSPPHQSLWRSKGLPTPLATMVTMADHFQCWPLAEHLGWMSWMRTWATPPTLTPGPEAGRPMLARAGQPATGSAAVRAVAWRSTRGSSCARPARGRPTATPAASVHTGKHTRPPVLTLGPKEMRCEDWLVLPLLCAVCGRRVLFSRLPTACFFFIPPVILPASPYTVVRLLPHSWSRGT